MTPDRVAADRALRRRMQKLTPPFRARAVAELGVDEARAFDFAWGGWAHDGQIEPAGDWTTWVIMAGRGFGKTRAGAEWVAGLVRGASARSTNLAGRPSFSLGTDASRSDDEGDTLVPSGNEGRLANTEPLRIALVAATLDEARRIMVEGASGLMAVAPDLVEDFSPTRRMLRLKGAEATLFSGASPEALRGPEHHIAWCDELAKWEKPGETWDMLRLGLRLGRAPRVLVTTTPRPGATLGRIMDAPGAVVTRGPTWANPHLADAFKAGVAQLYGGTRLGRQELEGELLSDHPGALWTVGLLERCRLGRSAPPNTGLAEPVEAPRFLRRQPERKDGPSTSSGKSGFGCLAQVAIGVDPPAGDGTCGIVVCARDAAGGGHVLADHSVAARTPEAWARAVAGAARLHGRAGDPALVVAEANQGGRMVESVLRTADPGLRIRMVQARLSKAERAQPVSMLFEAGLVRLHGRLPELEAQLCGLIGGGGYEGPGASPDRADAMVWALTALMLEGGAAPAVRRL